MLQNCSTEKDFPADVHSLQDEKGYRRAVNGLQRLGYRYEDIRQAISCFSLEADEDIYYE